MCDFLISDQSLIKENCHNSRANFDIDMEFELGTKPAEKSTAMPKKFDGYVMLARCRIIVIFSIYCEFEAIRKPDCGGMVFKQ